MLPARVRNKPQYVFHPFRAARRAMYGKGTYEDAEAREVADLPWGLPLSVYRADAIGFSILTGRVFDPCVTETLHRLIDPGDRVVDVGANVGYLTSLAAVRAGDAGSVLAFEPHPKVFELLSANVASWRGRGDVAPVEAHPTALSDHAGSGGLASGPLFHFNMGLASLETDAAAEGSHVVDVELARLDDVIGEGAIGLLKIDVEGHEPEVLRGAQRLLERHGVRDIVFEDHDDYPDACTTQLEAAGYKLFSLDNDLRGLRLGAPQDRGPTERWPGPSYLATADPERALGRLKPRGWHTPGIGPRWLRAQRA